MDISVILRNGFQDLSSEKKTDIECTDSEKELLDFVLAKYRDKVFEIYNIIARKLDEIKEERDMAKKFRQIRGIQQIYRRKEKKRN